MRLPTEVERAHTHARESRDARNESEVLMALCDGKPLHIDALADCGTFTRPELHATLMVLEMKGKVRRLPGNCYERLAAPPSCGEAGARA